MSPFKFNSSYVRCLQFSSLILHKNWKVNGIINFPDKTFVFKVHCIAAISKWNAWMCHNIRRNIENCLVKTRVHVFSWKLNPKPIYIHLVSIFGVQWVDKGQVCYKVRINACDGCKFRGTGLLHFLRPTRVLYPVSCPAWLWTWHLRSDPGQREGEAYQSESRAAENSRILD